MFEGQDKLTLEGGATGQNILCSLLGSPIWCCRLRALPPSLLFGDSNVKGILQGVSPCVPVVTSHPGSSQKESRGDKLRWLQPPGCLFAGGFWKLRDIWEDAQSFSQNPMTERPQMHCLQRWKSTEMTIWVWSHKDLGLSPGITTLATTSPGVPSGWLYHSLSLNFMSVKYGR